MALVDGTATEWLLARKRNWASYFQLRIEDLFMLICRLKLEAHLFITEPHVRWIQRIANLFERLGKLEVESSDEFVMSRFESIGGRV